MKTNNWKGEHPMLKNNFSLNTPVRFVKTGGDVLENQTGTILGKSFSDPVCDHYIVMLDVPQKDRLAVTITEACLVLA
jgi:hypothetical protein